MKKFLFRPRPGCYGIQRIDMVKDCMIVAGAGVGGGSLVYANTLYEPLDAFYRDPQWAHITDWRAELAPYYDQAKRMLGVVENPLRTPSDDVMEKVAEEMGVGDTFHPTPVGVFFGGSGQAPGETVADPFFGGAGPDRHTVHRLRRVHDRLPPQRQEHPGQELPLPRRAAGRPGPPAHHRHPGRARSTDGGYRVDARWTKAKLSAADAPRRRSPPSTSCSPPPSLGTQRLLHRLKAEGDLPQLSDRLGYLTRTNSESILGRDRARPLDRLQPGHRDHLVASTPTSTPTSSRCATARAATSCR